MNQFNLVVKQKTITLECDLIGFDFQRKLNIAQTAENTDSELGNAMADSANYTNNKSCKLKRNQPEFRKIGQSLIFKVGNC